MLTDSNKLRFEVAVNEGTSAYRSATGSTVLPANVWWYFLVGVYDGNECYVYVNGVLETMTYAGSSGSITPMRRSTSTQRS
jgi:hypothetical protein